MDWIRVLERCVYSGTHRRSDWAEPGVPATILDGTD